MQKWFSGIDSSSMYEIALIPTQNDIAMIDYVWKNFRYPLKLVSLQQRNIMCKPSAILGYIKTHT